MEDSDFLSKVPLFASTRSAHLSEIVRRVTTRNYRRNEVIFHQDDPGTTLHVIKKGQVKINTISPEGEEAILAILTEGDFFGELSLLDGKPRSANAVAMQATQTLALQRQDFMDILGKHPEMVGDILASLADRLRSTDHLLEDAIFLSLRARLAKRLLELAEKHGVKTDRGVEIDLHLTQQELAAALGVSRVALNKQLGLLQDRGLVSLETRHIIIDQPDDLGKCIR
ncbi:MAG TPA: Crp/Fnr family transcriptional regulator [Dehalococcoidia bacterium]|nr:Crp/Fnr family transcriptional regulator [Dehalococcoidia bacterium]